MMIQIPHAIGAGLFLMSLAPGCQNIPSTNTPTPPEDSRPVCITNVLLQSPDESIPCNINPPMTLSFVFDSLDDDVCLDAGGNIFTSTQNGLRICFDIDY